MTDLEKFVSILHSSDMEYFSYSDYDSYSNVTNYIIVYVNDIAIFHKFITYDEDKSIVQKYVSCSIEKSYSSLSEIVKEVMS
jgi:hypothetical protein